MRRDPFANGCHHDKLFFQLFVLLVLTICLGLLDKLEAEIRNESIKIQENAFLDSVEWRLNFRSFAFESPKK